MRALSHGGRNPTIASAATAVAARAAPRRLSWSELGTCEADSDQREHRQPHCREGPDPVARRVHDEVHRGAERRDALGRRPPADDAEEPETKSGGEEDDADDSRLQEHVERQGVRAGRRLVAPRVLEVGGTETAAADPPERMVDEAVQAHAPEVVPVRAEVDEVAAAARRRRIALEGLPLLGQGLARVIRARRRAHAADHDRDHRCGRNDHPCRARHSRRESPAVVEERVGDAQRKCRQRPSRRRGDGLPRHVRIALRAERSRQHVVPGEHEAGDGQRREQQPQPTGCDREHHERRDGERNAAALALSRTASRPASPRPGRG